MDEASRLVIGALDAALVALSLGLVLLLGRAAAAVGGRVSQTEGLSRALWLGAGALVLGVGLWTLHLAAALALLAPEARYDGVHGAHSLALAVAASALLLTVVGAPTIRWNWLLLGSALGGPALAAMHLLGMGALGLGAGVREDARIAAGVVAGATLLCGAGLWAADRFRLHHGEGYRWWQWINVALLLVTLNGMYASVYLAQGVTGASARPPAAGLLLTPDRVVPLAAGVLGALLLCAVVAGIDRRVRLRRAETEALRRSEDRFRSLVEASAQIVWTTAPDGQMTAEQRSWHEFTGQQWEEYRSWGWFNAVHPEDRERTARMWEEALANRRTMELEHRVRRHDGRYRDCVVRVVPVLERDGTVREWVGTHSDVTDRARMQEERDLLAEAGRVLSSSLDYRETLDAVARLLVPRLADWCTIDVRSDHDGLQRLVSTHVDPHRAELLREIRIHDGGPEAEHGTARVLRTRQSELVAEVPEEVLEDLAPDPDQRLLLGKVGVASLICVPLVARGQVLGVLTLALAGPGERYDLRDLALAEELARRSAVAIDNARLYEEAQGAIRARDDVLGVVSHDLRNPISTIAMSAEFLLEEDAPPDQRRGQLEIIRRSALGMNRLIQDLLDVSRTESGRLSVDPQPEDAAAMATEAVEMMRPMAAERSQRLDAEVAAGLPPVLADRSRILQVLSNLLGNAVKFTPEGGVIQLRAVAEAESVRFSVLDTGPGIPPENLPRLFERHWQAQETAHLGAGLGLAIAKGIVEAHGGSIWARSEPGKGTMISFRIPRAEGAERPWGGSGREELAAGSTAA